MTDLVERDYERPLVEPDGVVHGGFQSGRLDAAPNARTGRAAARTSLVLGILWVFGIGSLVAIAAAVLAFASGNIDRLHRRLAWIGLVLGVAGLVLSGAMFAAAA